MKTLLLIFTLVFGVYTATDGQMYGGMMNDSTHHAGMYNGMHVGMMNGSMMGGNQMMGNNMNGYMNHSMMGMGYGMMGSNGMMQNMPMRQCFYIINRLPSMQDQLSLTNMQENKLIDLEAEFKKNDAGLSAAFTKSQIKLRDLMKNNASTKEVSDQLKSYAATMADIGIAAYDFSAKMKDVLTDTQKQKLNEKMQAGGKGNSYMNNTMMNY